MARVALRLGPQVTPVLLETIAGYHGAIDSESGHIVCHGYAIRPAIIETDTDTIPALVIDDCVAYISDDDVDKLVRLAEEHPEIRISNRGVESRSGVIRTPWLLYVLGFSKDARSLPSMHPLRVTVNGDEKPGILVVFEVSGSKQGFLVFECGEEQREASRPVTHV